MGRSNLDLGAAQSASRGIGRNTLLNLAGSLAPMLVALATVPAYLGAIGQARYGLLSLAWLFLGYFGVFNLGLGRAAANQIAGLRAAPPEQRQRIFWTALALNGGLGVLGGLCLLLSGRLLLSHVLAIPPDLRTEAAGGLPWLALGVPFLTVSMVCVGSLEGLELFGVANGLDVAMTSVYQLAPLVVAYLVGPNLTWLIAAAAAGPLVGAGLGLPACARLLPLGRRPLADRRAARTLLSFGGWVTVTGVAGPLLIMLDRFMIGALSGPRAVTQYTVPLSLVSRLAVLPLSLARSLFPRLSALAEGEARTVAYESTRVLAVVTTPLAVLAMVLAGPFLDLWLGGALARRATPVAEIVLVGVWLNSLSLVPYTFLQARERPDLPAKFHLLELAPYAFALWIGLRLGGIEGAACVWTLRVAVDAVLLGAASTLYRGRVRLLLAPLLLVAAAYLAAAATGGSWVGRAALGGTLAALALVWACYAGPWRRRLLPVPRTSGATP